MPWLALPRVESPPSQPEQRFSPSCTPAAPLARRGLECPAANQSRGAWSLLRSHASLCIALHRFSSGAAFDTRLAVTQTPAGARRSQCSSFLPPKQLHASSTTVPLLSAVLSHGAKRARRSPGNRASISSEHYSAEEARQASRRQWCTIMQHQLRAAARRCPPAALSSAGLARIEVGGKKYRTHAAWCRFAASERPGARGPASVAPKTARQSAGWFIVASLLSPSEWPLTQRPLFSRCTPEEDGRWQVGPGRCCRCRLDAY
jgi:hypothetical protein